MKNTLYHWYAPVYNSVSKSTIVEMNQALVYINRSKPISISITEDRNISKWSVWLMILIIYENEWSGYVQV